MTVELPEVTVPGEGFLTWESQVRQYPKVGPHGFHYERFAITIGTGPVLGRDLTGAIRVGKGTYHSEVDCILYRNRKGHLVGVLNHYPNDEHELNGMILERAGNVNVFVRPNRRRRGIGRRLVHEAMRRWPIDWSQQAYTEGGRALVAAVLAEETARA